MKVANKILSISIILINFYFLPFTIISIRNLIGSIEYGLSSIPLTLSINLLLISAFLVFKDRFSKSMLLLVINALGLVWGLFVLWLLLTVPLMD